MEKFPHADFVEKAFVDRSHMVIIRLNYIYGGGAMVDIIGGVEAGEEDTVRFEAASEFGGDLQGDCPCEIMEGETGEDHINAVRSKWERLAVIQLNDVSVGSGQFAGSQVSRREIRGNDFAARIY